MLSRTAPIKAATKSRTWNPVTTAAASSSMSALITNQNRPRVSSVSGKVMILSTKPIVALIKTLVARGDRNGVCMAVIPGNQALNLKALAAVAGERKIQLVPVKELQSLTGYIRGGVTAFAAKHDFPVYVDETIELFDVVAISAGVRGLQILIAPADYLRATKGAIAALGQPKAG